MTELLPCPFCGGEAHIWNSGYFYNGKCFKCGCTLSGHGYTTEAEAIAAWNTRTERVDERETIDKTGDIVTHDNRATGGTLTAEQVMAIAGKHQPDYCSDTHVCFDWQAIADELNACAERTCHIEVHDNLAETDGMGDVWLECDECHWQMPLEPTTPRFKHCPNCGAKVVGE